MATYYGETVNRYGIVDETTTVDSETGLIESFSLDTEIYNYGGDLVGDGEHIIMYDDDGVVTEEYNAALETMDTLRDEYIIWSDYYINMNDDFDEDLVLSNLTGEYTSLPEYRTIEIFGMVPAIQYEWNTNWLYPQWGAMYLNSYGMDPPVYDTPTEEEDGCTTIDLSYYSEDERESLETQFYSDVVIAEGQEVLDAYGDSFETAADDITISSFDDSGIQSGIDSLISTVVASLGNFNQPVFAITKKNAKPLPMNRLSMLSADDDVTTATTVETTYTAEVSTED
jgi:hypothetical protein